MLELRSAMAMGRGGKQCSLAIVRRDVVKLELGDEDPLDVSQEAVELQAGVGRIQLG